MGPTGWENAKPRPWAAVSERFAITERHRFTGLPVIELDGRLLVVRATTTPAKLRALRGLDKLAPEHALQLPALLYQHTFGMRFAIDLIWLDAADDVVRVDPQVAPRRIRACVPARTLVQTAAGHAGDFIAAGLGARSQVPGQPVVAQPWARDSGLRSLLRSSRR